MRYTTIIDISTSEVYKNVNARLLYLHLCLKSGYHDDDKDLYVISIRNLAYELGLTLSATRFAVALLEKHNLLAHNGSVWRVRKWIEEKPITSRKKAAENARIQEKEKAAIQARQSEQDIQDAESRRLEEIRNSDKTPFEQYYESQLKKAAEGDPDAQRVVEKRRAMYEEIQKNKKQ